MPVRLRLFQHVVLPATVPVHKVYRLPCAALAQADRDGRLSATLSRRCVCAFVPALLRRTYTRAAGESGPRTSALTASRRTFGGKSGAGKFRRVAAARATMLGARPCCHAAVVLALLLAAGASHGPYTKQQEQSLAALVCFLLVTLCDPM
eukprot:365042-Chlamydomonas_euryale.AAC.36